MKQITGQRLAAHYRTLGDLEWEVESTTVTHFTFPVRTGGIFYFPWHRHQIEGTNGF